MAQPMTTTAAGRVNRRFLLLALILAALSAVLVYAAISRSGDGDGGGAAGDVAVVVAKSPITAGDVITGDMLEVRNVPESAVGEGAFRTTEAAIGEVARYPIAVNQQILLSHVVGGTADIATNDVLANIIEGGQRGMAITVEAVVNGGGLVLPGDHVDVFWTPSEAIGQDIVGSVLIAENVEVLAVSQTLVDIPAAAPGALAEGEPTPEVTGDERVRASDAEPDPEAATVVLLLSPQQVSRVFCADTDDGPLRLAVRAFGDETPSGLATGECVIPVKETQ